jgi:hypothetical protein
MPKPHKESEMGVKFKSISPEEQELAAVLTTTKAALIKQMSKNIIADGGPVKLPKLKKAQAKGKTEVTSISGATDTKETVIKNVLHTEELASVHFSMGRTVNMGNYESVKFTVSASMPCVANKESLDLAFSEVQAWVDDKMGKISEQVEGSK